MNRLQVYFNKVAEILDYKADLAGLTNHAASMGDSREIIIEEFLKKHIPNSFFVHQGGKIFDKDDNESKQVDVIIKNGYGLNFKELSKMFDCVESVVSVISIKSNLTKAKLKEALAEIESVPTMSNSVICMNTTYFTSFNPNSYISNFTSTYPVTVVFSYKGINLKTLLKHLENYYQGKSISDVRIPKLIWVNKKYFLSSIDLQKLSDEQNNGLIQVYSNNPDGYFVLPLRPKSLDEIRYIFKNDELTKETQGRPYLYLVGMLTSYNTWINNLIFNYEEYLN